MATRGSLSGVLCAGLFLSPWLGAASAFELETHRSISGAAFIQSTLGKGYVEGELRLSPTVSLGWGTETRTAQKWIGEGSVREDDTLRPRSHFYDPTRDRGFTSIICGGEGPAAPDWAFEQSTEPVDLRFSWREARESFFHALTDKTQKDREENLARTFRTLGGVLHRGAEPLGEARERASDGLPVERALTVQERVHRKTSEPDVGVGHGDVGPAAPVADGARLSARASGPYAQRPAGVDPCDGTAARAHGVDVENRDGDRLARDLELARPKRTAREQRHVGGRAAHVERDHVVVTRATSPGEGADHATRGAREHRVHGLTPRALQGKRPSVRAHDAHAVGAGVGG